VILAKPGSMPISKEYVSGFLKTVDLPTFRLMAHVSHAAKDLLSLQMVDVIRLRIQRLSLPIVRWFKMVFAQAVTQDFFFKIKLALEFLYFVPSVIQHPEFV